MQVAQAESCFDFFVNIVSHTSVCLCEAHEHRDVLFENHNGEFYSLSFAEDGRLKYKVSFEEKGKSLVSGHHIAHDTTPKLEQLYVGARVVVRSEENTSLFRPGILAELPSRKNRSRYGLK